MKNKTKKRIQGSISILLVIILMPMLTMSAIVVDSSRLNLAKSMVSSAGDLTVNTALANYDTILKDVYGLFAMSQNGTDADFQKRIREYFETTLVGYGVVDEENAKDYVEYLEGGISEFINGTSGMNEVSRNFLQMDIEDFSVTKVKNSSLANSEILRTQLVEYMKYRAPLSVGLSFLDSLKSFTTIQDQNNVVKSQVVAQESAQDVTSACKKSIDSIRDFDDLIESIQNGDKAVKGFVNPTDGKVVKIEDYTGQLGVYKSIWGQTEDYEHINALTLTYFTKNPGIGDKVLGNLGSTKFINSGDSYKLVTDNSGVSVNVSLAGEMEAAKKQYEDQLTKVNGLVGTVNNYVNHNFVPLGGVNIKDDSSAFVNESSATNAYINFEKFLLDQHSSINHKDIKNVLEQILTYRKYYENYRTYLVEIEKKEKAEMDEAQKVFNQKNSAYETAKGNRQAIITNAGGYRDSIATNVKSINTKTEAFNKKLSDGDISIGYLNGVYIDEVSLLSIVNPLLNELSVSATNRVISGYTFKNYTKLKNKLAVDGSSKNTYFSAFANVATYSRGAFSVPAKNFYDRKIAGKTSKTFSAYYSYLKNKPDDYELYDLLDYCSTKANAILKSISSYNSEISGYSEANSAYSSALTEKNSAETTLTNETTDYNNAVANRQNLDNAYINTVKQFKNGIDRYQTDLASYGKYSKTAQNAAVKIAKAIKAQFTAIEGNLKSIIDQLDTITTNLNTAKSMIETYNQNLTNWSNQNKSYATKNGSDTFSEQNTSEIEANKTQYDLDRLKQLQDYVKSTRDEYNELYSFVTNASNYKYGTTKIKDIDTAAKLTSAVSGVKDKLPNIVTNDDAKAQFDTLYPYYSAPKIFNESSQQKFLEPNILPLQFLIYLNSNYPEKTESTGSSSGSGSGSTSGGTTSGESSGTTEASYNSAKENLKKGSTKKAEPTGFGYTYSGKTIPGNLPSGTSDEPVSVEPYKMTETDGKINASSGFSSQAGVLDTVLAGIGNVATAGLENLYLLSYIFENFSYNTMVQDIVAKHNKAQEASIANKKKITPSAYLPELMAKTLSNYNIDAKNNFLYGGEVEYILYGSKTPANNVNAAKASIYALRFAFNCIYAFTDSEIKATTMSAGLAVQAATFGVVPYQIVQIVLQLALAAAESAIDLDYIGHGQKVAVIKSRDTWNLKASSIGKHAQDIANAAVDAAAAEVSSVVNGGIQKVLDAGTGELTGAIEGLANDLSAVVSSKAEEIVNTAFAAVNSKINDALNQVMFIDYEAEKANAKNKIDSIFADAKNIDYSSMFPGNEIAQKILSSNTVQNAANRVIDGIHSKVIAAYNQAPNSPSEIISGQINQWKQEAINSIQTAIKGSFQSAKTAVKDYANNISTKIKGYATDKVNELTEQGAEELKKQISGVTNEFMNNYIADGNAKSTVGSGLDANTKNGGTSLANIIAFGYKDYLMLFTYLKLCTSTGPESTVMKRIADVIQINIQKNTAGEFKHKKGSGFLMSNACTYVQVSATAHLDMLFLDMDFFNRMITDDSAADGKLDVESDLAGTKIKYSGFLGY